MRSNIGTLPLSTPHSTPSDTPLLENPYMRVSLSLVILHDTPRDHPLRYARGARGTYTYTVHPQITAQRLSHSEIWRAYRVHLAWAHATSGPSELLKYCFET